MSDGFDTDPVKVAELGLKSLGSSQQLAEAHLAAQDGLATTESAFGSTPAGATANGAHLSVAGAAGTLLGRFAGILEGDCDRLYQAAFHYQAADEASADQLGAVIHGSASTTVLPGTS